MSHWANVRSFGCFLYFEGSVPTRDLLEALIEELDLAADLKVSIRNNVSSWSTFNWKKIDLAIDDDKFRAINLLVGTVADVRLASVFSLRPGQTFPKFAPPPNVWLGAESQRWSEERFMSLARRWLRIAAASGAPLSGGILAATDLRNAKVEMSKQLETDQDDVIDQSPDSFHTRMLREHTLDLAKSKVRRVYPVTLLGPTFAQQVDVSQLAAAGATNIEQIAGSIIFDATPTLLEAWSPEYLAATVELRRLLWPMSFQHPADDPDPPPPKPSKRPRRTPP